MDRWRIFGGELIPAFRSHALHRKPKFSEQRERDGMDLTLGVASSRIGAETACAFTIEDRLGENRARTIAGA
jgi:hypothetical protein